LNSGPYMLGHSHSFDDAYDHTLKPRGMSGSASTLWESSGMEDTEVDYISLGEERNISWNRIEEKINDLIFL